MSEVSDVLEQQPPSANPEPRPEAEVLAAGAAQADAVRDLEAAHAAAEDPERRQAEVKIWVEAECDYFDIQPKDDPVADQLTALFCEHEQRQHERGRSDYDVTQEQRRRLDRIIERGFEHDASESTIEELAEVADGTETAADMDETTALERQTDADAYRELIEELRAEGLNNEQLVTRLANDASVPETERARWQSFNRIMTIAAAVPADRGLIVSRLNALDMSQGAPDPIQFIRTAIFSSPDFDSGVSQATQDAIAAEFGITPTRPARPRNATEMQTALREGRGTRPITEIQEVEEPPGSGNWVEREVVVGEETIPFTPDDKLMLSQDPPIGIFPVSEGSETHRIEGAAAGQPIQSFEIDVSETGSLPSAEIHAQTNKNIYETIFRSRGLAGSFQALLDEGDSTLGPETETTNGATDNDALQGLNQMFFGFGDVTSRFLSSDEIQRAHDHGTRWLVPGGDFGTFTEVDTAASEARLQALFGRDPSQMAEGMRRATPIINSGGAVTPSFEALYAGLHPDDAANGYPRLLEILGADGMAVLDLPNVDDRA